MVKKWLITGGCGFVGRNLIQNLIKHSECYIRIIDNFTVGTRQGLAQVCRFNEGPVADLNGHAVKGIDLVVGDILDDQLALKVVEGIDIIVHLAANTGVYPSVQNPRSDCLANVMGTLNYLEAARQHGVKRFVFASSSAPVGECQPPIHEALAPRPVSPYGASKLAGEGYCSAYFRTFGIQTAALRFSNVYGPFSEHKESVVAKFIKGVMDGKNLKIHGDGDQSRDFIYIDDLIDAIRLAAGASHCGGEIFQIATNRETTVLELASKILAIFELLNIGSATQIKTSDPRPGDVKYSYADIAKAKRMLNWHPNVSLDEGLRKTVRWFQTFYKHPIK
jgi:UDP-glucose 4-epimerase